MKLKALWFFIVFLSSFILLGAFRAVDADLIACPDVIINEFSAYSDPEWVELLNRTNQAIDLSGWQLQDFTGTDLSGTNLEILSGTIAANGIFVFEYGALHLNNDGDGITLLCPIGLPASAVTYGKKELPGIAKVDIVQGEKEFAAFINNAWVAQTTNSKGQPNSLAPTSVPTLTPAATLTPTPLPTAAAASTTPTPTPAAVGGEETSATTAEQTPATTGCSDSPPGGAPKITAVIARETSVSLTWEPAADPVSYYLLAYGIETGNYIFGNPNIGGKATRNFTVRNLLDNTRYYFVLRAGNGCKPGPFSEEVTAITGKQQHVFAANFDFFPEPKVLSAATVKGKVLSPTPSPSPTPTREFAFPTLPPPKPSAFPNESRFSSFRWFLLVVFILLALLYLLYKIVYSKKTDVQQNK